MRPAANTCTASGRRWSNTRLEWVMTSTPSPSCSVAPSIRSPTNRSASTSRPESSSSMTANAGFSTPNCRASLRLRSPPDRSHVHGTLKELLIEADPGRLLAHPLGHRGSLFSAHRLGQHVQQRHARHLGGVLHGQEQARLGPPPRGQPEQFGAIEADRPLRHVVSVTAGDHVGQRRLARAVGSHHRVHLARGDLQVDSGQDLAARHRGPQAFDNQRAHEAPPASSSPSVSTTMPSTTEAS